MSAGRPVNEFSGAAWQDKSDTSGNNIHGWLAIVKHKSDTVDSDHSWLDLKLPPPSLYCANEVLRPVLRPLHKTPS